MMKKDKTIVRKISEEQIIKAFLFTVEEYKRFGKYFPVIKKHTLLDDYKEDDYVAVQTKLMILRKYSYRSDTVYIPKVIEAAKNLYKDINVLLTDIQSRYDDIEKNQLQAVLSDGSKLSLFEMQECVVYGLYLHADEDKIEKLLSTNEALVFTMNRKFVEDLEELLLEFYELLITKVQEKYERKQYQKASMIFAGDSERNEQEIKGSPFWSNLYGKDASEEELRKTFFENTEEDMIIILKCLAFLTEGKKDNYSVNVLEKLVFPPTREQWGDFSQLNSMCKNELSQVGWSTKVRYNDEHNMAYVHLYPNVEEPFLLEQPHVITDLTVITLVYENDTYGWRIFAIGGRVESYKENISLGEWFRRVFEKNRKED